MARAEAGSSSGSHRAGSSVGSSGGPPSEELLLAELRAAIAKSPERPLRIEVGVALSIALGRRRGSVSCGGCEVPLEFEGIPAVTDARLTVPFRLVLAPGTVT
jgi:hypothetical protein